MNILLISSRFYPDIVGSGNAAYLIAKELAQHGNYVTVLTDVGIKNKIDSDQVPFKLKFAEDLEAFCCGRSGFEKPLEALVKTLGDVKPDLVYVHNFMPMLLVSMSKAWLKSTPVVFTFHNTPNKNGRSIGLFEDRHKELDLELARFIVSLNAYDAVFLGSRNYLQAAKNYGIKNGKTKFSYYGVDLAAFSKPKEDSDELNQYLNLELLRTKKVVLLPGRMTARKGVKEAIAAVAKLKKEHYPILLLLTGMTQPFDVGFAEEIRALIQKENVADKVCWPTKQIPRELLPSLYRLADVVIVPSHYEGLGLAAIEAQASGIPLVASKTDGLDEIAVNNHNALTVKVGDVNALAQSIKTLIDDQALAKKLTKQAKQDCQKFDIKRYSQDFMLLATELHKGVKRA